MKQNGKRSATHLHIICNGTAVESPVTINYHHTQRNEFLRTIECTTNLKRVDRKSEVGEVKAPLSPEGRWFESNSSNSDNTAALLCEATVFLLPGDQRFEHLAPGKIFR